MSSICHILPRWVVSLRVSLWEEVGHVGHCNTSILVLDVTGVGIEAVCEGNHSNPSLSGLENISNRNRNSWNSRTYNINQKPEYTPKNHHRSSSYKNELGELLHGVCVQEEIHLTGQLWNLERSSQCSPQLNSASCCSI
jgi:hypothetical protein